MVLLHYLVVPGFGDSPGPRSGATVVRADEATSADLDALVTAAAAPAAGQRQAAEAE